MKKLFLLCSVCVLFSGGRIMAQSAENQDHPKSFEGILGILEQNVQSCRQTLERSDAACKMAQNTSERIDRILYQLDRMSQEYEVTESETTRFIKHLQSPDGKAFLDVCHQALSYLDIHMDDRTLIGFLSKLRELFYMSGMSHSFNDYVRYLEVADRDIQLREKELSYKQSLLEWQREQDKLAREKEKQAKSCLMSKQ